MDKSNKITEKKYPTPFSMRFTEDERNALEIAAAGRSLVAYTR